MKGDKPVILEKKISLEAEKLLEFYHKKEFQAARIYSLSNPCNVHEKLLWEKENENIQIETTDNQLFISTNNRVYNRCINKRMILINKNKFYVSSKNSKNKSFSPLKANILQEFEYQILVKRFSWLRFIRDEKVDIIFNSVVRYKLFNLKKALSHFYKCPYPQALILHKYNLKIGASSIFKQALKYTYNLENLNEDLLHNFDFFKDCTTMAQKMNTKVNAAWSMRRLREVHDEWSETIASLLFSADDREMKIEKIFEGFAQFANIRLIKNTKELALEGLKQKHCVAGYTTYIEKGNCAIFHVDGYTLQIMKSCNGENSLILGQFNGFADKPAPIELKRIILERLIAFNKIENPSSYVEEELNDEIPF